jgi:hypothetical protein
MATILEKAVRLEGGERQEGNCGREVGVALHS